MPAFKFKLSQCVSVPGEAGVQGRVSGRSEFVGAPNLYRVAWLGPDLKIADREFAETDLLGDAIDAALPAVEFVAEPQKPAKRKAKR